MSDNRCPHCGTTVFSFVVLEPHLGQIVCEVCQSRGMVTSRLVGENTLDFKSRLIVAFTHPAHLRTLADDEIAIKRETGEYYYGLDGYLYAHRVNNEAAFFDITRALEGK